MASEMPKGKSRGIEEILPLEDASIDYQHQQ